MLKRLEHKKVPIPATKPEKRNNRASRISCKIVCFQDPELKVSCQKAFVSYSPVQMFVQKDKEDILR